MSLFVWSETAGVRTWDYSQAVTSKQERTLTYFFLNQTNGNKKNNKVNYNRTKAIKHNSNCFEIINIHKIYIDLHSCFSIKQNIEPTRHTETWQTKNHMAQKHLERPDEDQ